MKIEQIYTGCLAQGAYFISSNGEAVVIDPLRDPQPYIDKAKADNVTIKYIFETHFHADFVSGHVDLAKKTGATIVFGPNANPTYDAKIATDGELINLGNVTFKVLHTPGHTMESTCYLLMDEQNLPNSIYTGDTLFIGDVGRPDLAQKNGELTTEDLAGYLFDSLRNKVMPLPDSLLVYPAHGAGSACGKNMSKETFDLLGNQKQNNYALRADMTKAEFVKELTDGIPAPPAYFGENVRLNKHGYENLEVVLKKGMVALSPDEFEMRANATGAIVLDTRNQDEFGKGFIPNSIYIGIDGGFAPWVGALITDINQPILVVADNGRETEVVQRLARVGYDNTIGFLEGGFETWKQAGKEIETITSIPATQFAELSNTGITILDVRKSGEYNPEHVVGALNKPLDDINQQMSDLDKNATYYVHCAGGYRSMIYASILKSRGFGKLINVTGGYAEIKQTNIQKETTACSSGK
ncbi:MAG: MBL fold metallo-hydrolase [bacterium]|nr:MBL fold metallo-hydrolase [bacterium]